MDGPLCQRVGRNLTRCNFSFSLFPFVKMLVVLKCKGAAKINCSCLEKVDTVLKLFDLEMHVLGSFFDLLLKIITARI